MKGILKSVVALSALAAAFSQPAFAASVTWDMAAPNPESNFLTQNLRFFVNRVEELSKGDFQIKLHTAGSLIKDQETKQAVRTGQVTIGEMYVYVYGNESPIFETSTLPFIAGDGDKAFKLWTIAKPYVEEQLAKQRIKVLYTTPWPAQAFYTTKPVRSIDDLKNLKVRVYSTKTARLAELLGAEPVQIVMSEIAQAFATGLAGAMYTSPQTGVQTQSWDFAKYVTYTYGGNRPLNAIVINQRAYDKLSDANKMILMDAAIDAQTRGWIESELNSKHMIEVLKEKGMIVEEPSPEFRALLDKIGNQMLEEWAAEAGELGQKVLAEFKK